MVRPPTGRSTRADRPRLKPLGRIGDQHRATFRLSAQPARLDRRRPRATACSDAAASNALTALVNLAITPSPRLFTTVPPDTATTSRLARSNSAVRTSATTSPTRPRHAVEPTTSVNTTVTLSARPAPMRHSTARLSDPLLEHCSRGLPRGGESINAPPAGRSCAAHAARRC